MGKFKLDSAGVQKIRKLLEHQVVEVEKKLAETGYAYFMTFGYHAKWPPGPDQPKLGWTWYYAANWNVSLNVIDESVLQPPRPVDDPIEFHYAMSVDVSKFSVVNGTKCGDTIYITNSVYYGDWLNRGNYYMEDTFWKVSKPNRFMELCLAELQNKAKSIVLQVKMECPSI